MGIQLGGCRSTAPTKAKSGRGTHFGHALLHALFLARPRLYRYVPQLAPGEIVGEVVGVIVGVVFDVVVDVVVDVGNIVIGILLMLLLVPLLEIHASTHQYPSPTSLTNTTHHPHFTSPPFSPPPPHSPLAQGFQAPHASEHEVDVVRTLLLLLLVRGQCSGPVVKLLIPPLLYLLWWRGGGGVV